MIRPAALAALFLFASATAPALAKGACHGPDVIAAMQFRQLQIELNVAALKCEGPGYDFPGRYAAFLESANPALKANAQTLKAVFKGGFDRYQTSVANHAQIQSSSVANYCEAAAQQFDQVTSMAAHDLPAFAAHTVGTPYAGHPCAEAKPTKPAKHGPVHKIKSASL